MASKEDLKRQVCEAIERRADALIGLGETIRHQPELGFKEFKTDELVAKTFAQIDVPHRTGLAITGVNALQDQGDAFALVASALGLQINTALPE